VTAGESFSALIDDQDRVWVFGWNKRGQLGLPLARYPGLSPEQRIERSLVQIPEIRAKKIAGGGDFLLVADLEGRLWSSGWNYTDQLELGHERTVSQNLRVKDLAVGLCHSLVLDLEDQVWSFGANCFGQLGLGHTNYQNRPVQIPGLKAKLIRAGPAMSAVIVLAYRLPFRRN
jgi:alpha-tubulin suppressor-like RCC1 family protein